MESEEARCQYGIEVQIRVGLNGGEVVVRTIGNDLHMDYSAIGQTTHLAARMEQLATPGTIRLTMNTLRLAEDFIQVKSLGLVPVKGLQDPKVLETRSADRLDEQVERLAYHAQRGEVWDKALVYFRQAGAKAAARSANREAVSCFEQALVALEHLPESPEVLEQAVDLRFDLRNALFPLGEYEQILNFLREKDASLIIFLTDSGIYSKQFKTE